MKIFVSWSKETSHKVALALREWLPQVIQQVDPCVSSEDIAKGDRGGTAIARELAGTDQGVICLTKTSNFNNRGPIRRTFNFSAPT